MGKLTNEEFKKQLIARAFKLARDLDKKLVQKINELLEEVNELVKILGSSIATLKGKRIL